MSVNEIKQISAISVSYVKSIDSRLVIGFSGAIHLLTDKLGTES